jgi:type I restriction enzyme S subunit
MNKIEKLIAKLCPNGVEFKKLGDVITKNSFKQFGASELESLIVEGGNVKLLPSSQNYDWWTNEKIAGNYLCEGEVITLGRARYANLKYHKGKFVSSNNHIITPKDKNEILGRYLFHFIEHHTNEFYIETSIYPKFDGNIFDDFPIPLPPLHIQGEIVQILDNFTELEVELEVELEARKKQYEYYRNELLTFDDDVPMVKLEEVCKFLNGKAHEHNIVTEGKHIVVNSKFISSNGQVRKFSDACICPVYKNDILMVMSDLPNGQALAKCFLVENNDIYTLNQRICALTVKNNNVVITKFLFYIVNRNIQLLRYDNGVDQTNLKRDQILEIKIPIPPFKEQERIVSILNRFDTLINDITSGLPAEINARHQQYEYYRNKLLTFKEKII